MVAFDIDTSMTVFWQTEMSLQMNFLRSLGIVAATMALLAFARPTRAQCPADWDGNGPVETADLFTFLDDWFAGSADYDRNRVVEVSDLYAFLDDWFAPSPSCGQGLSSSHDPFFYQQFVQPSLASIAAITGVQTYSSDIVVLRPNVSSGNFDVLLWNPDIQGVSGVLGSASGIRVFHDGGSWQVAFADATASFIHRTLSVELTGALGDPVYLCGVGVEVESSCGNPDAADLWAILPLAIASDSSEAGQLCEYARPDYTTVIPPDSAQPLCAMIVSGSDAGAIGEIAQVAASLGCSGFEAAVVRAMASPQTAAAIMGIGEWTDGDSGLVLPTNASEPQTLTLTSSTDAVTIGSASLLSTAVLDVSSTVPTGYVVPDSGEIETMTVTPAASVLSVNLDSGYSGYAVVFGAHVSASTSQQCPIMCGAVSAVFSSQAMADMYLERAASAGIAPESTAATAILLTGDLPPGYDFPPGYIYPTVPPSEYPTEDLPVGPESMPGHWDKDTIACFAKFNDDLRAAEARRSYARSQCTHWDLGNIGGGIAACGALGGGIGAGIGVWFCGAGAIPSGAIGGIIGGCVGIPVGAIGGYQLCLAKADRGYDTERDAAIRDYLNCICKYGYCVQGLH